MHCLCMRSINVIAVDEDGIRHRIPGLIGHNLMEALKLTGFESEGEWQPIHLFGTCGKHPGQQLKESL
jgi:hypothetical protein